MSDIVQKHIWTSTAIQRARCFTNEFYMLDHSQEKSSARWCTCKQALRSRMLQTYYSSQGRHAGWNKMIQPTQHLSRQHYGGSFAACICDPNLVHHIWKIGMWHVIWCNVLVFLCHKVRYTNYLKRRRICELANQSSSETYFSDQQPQSTNCGCDHNEVCTNAQMINSLM